MSENPRPQEVDSEHYRRLRRRRREREVLKRKIKLCMALIVAALVLVVVLVLKVNDVFYRKAAVSTLTVKNDGSIVLEEVVPVKNFSADKADIKASVKKSIEDFATSDVAAPEDPGAAAGSKVGTEIGKITLAAVHVKDDTAYVRTVYPNAVTYAAYSGYKCYIGSVTGAKAAGYAFSDPLCPVVGTERGEAAAAESLSDTDSMQVVIINEDINVRVPGTVTYVSANVETIADEDETAASGTATYGTSIAPDTYVLYDSH